MAHIAVQGSAVAPSGCITQRKYKGDNELLGKKKKDSLDFQLQTSNFHFASHSAFMANSLINSSSTEV